MSDEITRRDFVKETVAGTAALVGAGMLRASAADPGEATLEKRVVSALGSVFVPSKPGDPGYAELEQYGISDYVMKPPARPAGGGGEGEGRGGPQSAEWLKRESLEAFNDGAKAFFSGKPFIDLDEKQKEEYLGIVVDGKRITDEPQRKQLQMVYQNSRRRILQVYYSNYPEHQIKRDASGVPILKPGDSHQITNPNTKNMVTGWDVTGFAGQPTWEEEQALREKAKQSTNYWFEGDLITLDPKRPPAAAAIKTSDGKDYYDVLVLGGGTAGCIIAGRLAQRGVNPKTGDRLRVAMIEGGDDWTIRDPGIRPGYGYPIRRRMITDVSDGIGPDGVGSPAYQWPAVGSSGENFKVVGGCATHYGGQAWLPQEEDFAFYREASGVDWDMASFGDAIQEVRDLLHIQGGPDHWWSNAHRVWVAGGKALGFEMRQTEQSFRNSLGVEGLLNKYDAKGTTLPWAYIGMNNGLKVIANAEVEKILIEKPAGGRPVAVGAVYKDKAGVMHEVRAARIVSAMGTNFTPGLLYRSGYGPREYLGDMLIVENNNVGANMSCDFDLVSSAFLAEELTPPTIETRIANREGPWCSTTPRPWGELNIQIRSGGQPLGPGGALSYHAPGYGWDHKEFMRNSSGGRRILEWRTHFGAVPAKWRVRPDRELEQYDVDEARINAKINEGQDIIRSWHAKLPVKVVRADLRAFAIRAQTIDPFHRVGTARAGSSRENSVCSSDFDCHDIDHLLFTSSSTIPKTFFWSMVPTSVNAAYGWRRMVANHFSKGSSTKGFA
jgi:choline dehydrogenase-like flavoprotein